MRGRSMDLTLVFEYIDQDLSAFLAKVPNTGLSLDKIKVWSSSYHTMSKVIVK